ncbi:MAG: anion permease [Cyclobacteriaceae bacterium]|nr:anion permease [Cyclobacteriaceae bacterium]
MEQNLVFAALIFVLILFAWGKWRHDLVALMALFFLVVTGIVAPDEAFSGFAHPAVITVAAVLIIGKALEYSGIVDLIGRWVAKAGNNLTLQIFALSALVAVASAFMNNVGALAILMPVAIQLSRKGGHPPSYLLMPVAFASLFGGMITLIGTPPNIIIASFRASHSGEPFSMFDFAPVGLALSILGIIFIALVGWRLLPKRKSPKSGKDLFNIDDYIAEIHARKDSLATGKTLQELIEMSKADIQILGLVRNNQRIHAPQFSETLQNKDILIIETAADELKTFIDDTGLVIGSNKKFRIDAEGSDRIAITEAIVTSESSLIGQSASSLKMRSRYGINILAIARKDRKILRRIDRVHFKSGDVLLLQGREHLLHDTIQAMDCLPLAQRELKLGYKTKIPTALSLFGISIILVVSGILPVDISFSIAAVAMVVAGVLPINEMYKSIDWPVIVLLAAMIPFGMAMENTGGAKSIAEMVVLYGETLQPWALLTMIMIITILLSSIINNAATVVLMAPIVLGISQSLDYAADPFLMTVAVGASSAFLTPIGHQSNTLVMGPGGYKFTDYTLMGLPIVILICLAGIPMIMYFWPLQ